MPYKFEKEKVILGEVYDRRRKLSEFQKDKIRELYLTGFHSLNSLAKLFNVSKKTILLIVNPISKEKNDNRLREHWKDYHNKEKQNIAMKKTREYKKNLYDKGLIK